MISQEDNTNPPFKHFWGPASIGVIVLFLGLTLLFPSVREHSNQSLSQKAESEVSDSVLVMPNRKESQDEPDKSTLNYADGSTRFQGSGRDDRFIEAQFTIDQLDLGSKIMLDPPPKFDPDARINEAGLYQWNDYNAVLLKTIPLTVQSQDDKMILQGYLSLWMNEDQLLWNFDASLAPIQAEGIDLAIELRSFTPIPPVAPATTLWPQANQPSQTLR